MDSNFNKSDFAGLKFKVNEIDLNNCDIHHSFPEIKYHKEFGQEAISKFGSKLKFPQVFAYICYVYDNDSPFIKAYDSLAKRKKMAADAVHFKRRLTGAFEEEVEDIIRCSNHIVNAMIIRFARIKNNAEWGSLLTYSEAKQNADVALLDSTLIARDREINMKISLTMEKEISRLQKAMVKDDNDDIIKMLYSAIEDEELATPEFIALKAFQRENPELCNPYINRIPIEQYMEKVKENESPHEWDNPDLVPEADE